MTNMVGIQAPREEEIGRGPHLWIQWKGTEVCCDFRCSCGATGHIDADFLYGVVCGKCGQAYEVGTHVTLYPIADRSTWWIDDPHIVKTEE